MRAWREENAGRSGLWSEWETREGSRWVRTDLSRRWVWTGGEMVAAAEGWGGV